MVEYMSDFHIELAHQKIGLHSNLPFWISMLSQSKKILPRNKVFDILDFGCGDGYFLQIIDLFLDFDYALGVDIDKDLICQIKSKNNNTKIHYIYDDEQNKKLQKTKKSFDIIYSQEVLYTMQNLKYHAQMAFDILKNKGFYFATMGCYIENPYFQKRREIIKKDSKYSIYDYSLNEVVDIFYNVGFEVCIKKLPMEYFAVYSKSISKSFGSMLDLVNHCSDYKMLFCFYKDIA